MDRTLRKELRHMLNKYGAEKVQSVLDELVANPTEKYRQLWSVRGLQPPHRYHGRNDDPS